MSVVQLLDLGTTAAKRASTDDLLSLSRQLIKENPAATDDEIDQLYIAALEDDDGLARQSHYYTAVNHRRRCQERGPKRDRVADEEEHQRLKAAAREIITAKFILWTWKLPTNGKPVCDCTFGEIGEAAPLIGRFLAKLAAQGAPGALVREVFTDKAALQKFWEQAQS